MFEPKFDVMSPEQEKLAIEFVAEINGAGGTDPVRLLEMAEALYEAERLHYLTES